jgi:hypothetical protein
MPAKTYTIATAHEMMIAIVPDGQDIAAEVERTAAESGITFDQFDTTTGLTLTDEPLADDQIVVYGDKMGRVTDEDGIGYLYAVKRRDDAADLLRRRHRTDDELADIGGRAAYLQALREDLAAAQARLDGGFAADDARVDPVIRVLFDAEDPVLWKSQREGVIQQLEIALAANLFQMHYEEVYGVAVVPFEIWEKIDENLTISGSGENVKFLCANDAEKDALQAVGVSTLDCADYFKIIRSDPAHARSLPVRQADQG